jgi:serine/tyrosine/threonine adenylyltransferase
MDNTRTPTRPVFENTYLDLPSRCYVRSAPEPVPAARLLYLNRSLCAALGLDPDGCDAAGWAALCSGAVGGADALALAYAGHQFGHFSPSLGDGRAHLLGELRDAAGRRHAVQLKGSGRTAYSRGGDGLAALGPVLREYLLSEAMHALGVPTTRALAVVATGRSVYREGPLPGAILTRVARGLLRVGSFEYFAARGDSDALDALLGLALRQFHPELVDHPAPALALLTAVAGTQASLIAQWMALGFIHGVMNTDNVAISGETLDYGPCTFMNTHDAATVYSAIDRQGRYAYGNQPAIAQWNLARLAEALLPVFPGDGEQALADARAVIEAFPAHYRRALVARYRAKLGLGAARDGDEALIDELLRLMQAGAADHTRLFRRLCDLRADPRAEPAVHALFTVTDGLSAWLERWQVRVGAPDPAAAGAMRAVNPALIPRNHHVDAALRAAVEADDFAPYERLQRALSTPYQDRPEFSDLAQPPPPGGDIRNTFCGT